MVYSLTEQIGQQVCLLRLDELELTDVNTVRARFEAIRQFASQGLVYLEQGPDETDVRRPRAT